MGEKNEQKLSRLVETITAASHLSNRLVQDQLNEPCCSLSLSLRSLKGSVSRLQQSVFGDEPLHALPFQELHGSPVDLAAVLWLSERSQLLLDVLQPQIFGKNTKQTVYFTPQVCKRHGAFHTGPGTLEARFLMLGLNYEEEPNHPSTWNCKPGIIYLTAPFC